MTQAGFMGDLSDKMLAYLAQIYRLSNAHGQSFVSTSSLAEEVDVSAPAVNRMVNKLKEQGFLQHEPYHGIRLTERGREEALKQLRRHRIAEAFLMKVMGFRWDEVHEEAMNISQSMSDAVTERMYQMAGQPTHCPHGEPIPQADGTLDDPEDQLLSTIEAGTKVRIIRILTREPDRLQYLQALGLMPGTEVEVLHVAPFHGPMQLKLGDEYRIIGHNLAELIRVKGE
jgi:DtxR family Mn-dependent transcriptional regulator